MEILIITEVDPVEGGAQQSLLGDQVHEEGTLEFFAKNLGYGKGKGIGVPVLPFKRDTDAGIASVATYPIVKNALPELNGVAAVPLVQDYLSPQGQFGAPLVDEPA